MEFIRNGAAILNERIKQAARNPDGGRVLTVTGNYEIEDTVLIPSGFTLLLEDCHLEFCIGRKCTQRHLIPFRQVCRGLAVNVHVNLRDLKHKDKCAFAGYKERIIDGDNPDEVAGIGSRLAGIG